MQGLMMDAPLLIKNIAQHGSQHGKREIVSITAKMIITNIHTLNVSVAHADFKSFG